MMSEKREPVISGEGIDDQDAARERIAQRAHELYELRGREDGFDLQDWLQAEQEVRGETKQADQSAAAEGAKARQR